jgi:hypothetical protein
MSPVELTEDSDVSRQLVDLCQVAGEHDRGPMFLVNFA